MTPKFFLNQSSPVGSGTRAITTVGVCTVISVALESFYGIPQADTMMACTVVSGVFAALWKKLRG